jgi:two-component system chemotaxis response regulator CheB
MEDSHIGTGVLAPLGTRTPFDLVVVAASSGGLEALIAVFSSLPVDFSIPIAVVLHRSLQAPEMLATLLGSHTPLRVKTAAPGETPRAGTIYIAPPHRHLVLAENRTFAFQHVHLVHHTPSAADPLFLSAASVYRDRVVAVVLSGGDVDGAAGATAIGDAGGVVLAQNQATSRAFSMPAATIATGHVDAVLAPGQIAIALKSLALTGVLTPP